MVYHTILSGVYEGLNDSSGKYVHKIVDKERNLDEIKDLIKHYGRRGVWRDNRD